MANFIGLILYAIIYMGIGVLYGKLMNYFGEHITKIICKALKKKADNS